MPYGQKGGMEFISIDINALRAKEQIKLKSQLVYQDFDLVSSSC